ADHVFHDALEFLREGDGLVDGLEHLPVAGDQRCAHWGLRSGVSGGLSESGGMIGDRTDPAILPYQTFPTLLLVRERRDSRKRAAAEKLERRPASGGDVCDSVGHARLLDR